MLKITNHEKPSISNLEKPELKDLIKHVFFKKDMQTEETTCFWFLDRQYKTCFFFTFWKITHA